MKFPICFMICYMSHILFFDCYISSGLDGAAIQGNSLLEQMFSTVCAYEGEALTPTKRNADMFLFTGYRLKKICCFVVGGLTAVFSLATYTEIFFAAYAVWNIHLCRRLSIMKI